MKQYLFLLSIGPVQAFIGQARKTQDLYAGSRILSVLAKAGLEAAKPIQMVFPNSTTNESVPNRFLCIIKSDDPKQEGKRIENVVRSKWIEISKQVLAHEQVLGIKEQIDAHLDINWVYLEISPDYSDYKTKYEKIERLMGAAKNAKSYTQYNYQEQVGEKGRKCILDGERNVKFYRLNDSEKRNEVLAKKLYCKESEVCIIDFDKERDINTSSLQSGEGLSAVSMVKRLYGGSSFVSTADIALKHTFEQLKVNERFNLLIEEIKISQGGLMNAQLFYEESHAESFYKKQGINLGSLEILKSKQSELSRLSKSQNLQLTKYYTLIDFDGDKMGEWLSGQNISKPSENLLEFHQKLSKQLALFAKEATKIVNKYGQTVYAGGDDFLGFVNLNYLFKSIVELRTKFKELVNDHLQTLGYLNSELSFSAGICIAHYKEPLGMVLSKASSAQKTAKHQDKGKRDAFCILASKHSGENHETYLKWGVNCKNVNDIQIIIDGLVKSNSFSNTFIKSLTIEFEKLKDLKGRLTIGKDVLKIEVDRLIKRSYMGEKDEKEIKCKEFSTAIISLYDNALNFDNFISALQISDFIHRLLNNEDLKTNHYLNLQTN